MGAFRYLGNQTRKGPRELSFYSKAHKKVPKLKYESTDFFCGSFDEDLEMKNKLDIK
jgi:hypothetical protein